MEFDALECAHYAVRRHLKGRRTTRQAYDEMLSDALLGIATALTRYTPGGTATLWTYASRRADGAILDGFRARSPIARRDWENGHRDPATLRPERQPALPIDAGAGHDVEAPDPYARVEDADHAHTLLAACTDLERRVVLATIVEGYQVDEVAHALGLTSSRICQIRRKALAKARAAA